jgi:hypothetical protein
LSDKGKMDAVISVQMICEEDKGNVAVASVYGLVKCFGPKNCLASVDGSTLTALLSEPGLERQSGINLFKEFDEMQPKARTTRWSWTDNLASAFSATRHSRSV